MISSAYYEYNTYPFIIITINAQETKWLRWTWWTQFWEKLQSKKKIVKEYTAYKQPKIYEGLWWPTLAILHSRNISWFFIVSFSGCFFWMVIGCRKHPIVRPKSRNIIFLLILSIFALYLILNGLIFDVLNFLFQLNVLIGYILHICY